MKTNDHNPTAPIKNPTAATILLVEDDPAVRNIVRIILSRGGYQVIEADSEQEALWQWEKHWRDIDLLFTDIMIPSCSTGVELARKMRSRKTDLRVVFTSGFSREMGGIDFGESDGNFFLQKPYEPAELLAKVRECLDEGSSDMAPPSNDLPRISC